jgi:hypothetical protein
MVPISLYVSIELVKLAQVYFIQKDHGEGIVRRQGHWRAHVAGWLAHTGLYLMQN